MLLVDADNAAPYLRVQGWVDARERLEVAELAGGVSNLVLYVHRPERPGADFVVKQARAQLRVPEPWFCGVERIWREVAVLGICQRVLHAAGRSPHCAVATPEVLHEDRQNFAFAMTAAPRDHRVWKNDLLAGHIDCNIARSCGWLLGTLHAGTWHDAATAAELDDRQIFDQLRLDPYYRTVAAAHADAADCFQRLCDSVWNHRHALVHADFSPKNLLVYDGGLMLLDFETGHYGDPAFDLGFFLAHLVLKAVRAAPRHAPLLELIERFEAAYGDVIQPRIGSAAYAELWQRGVRNLAGCTWARLDGKSRIDYLAEESRREFVRNWCRELLADDTLHLSAALAVLRTID